MSRDIKNCVQILRDAWAYAQNEFKIKFPSAPQPFLTCSLRTCAEQAALFAQGRQPLKVNSLRAIAGLPPIPTLETFKKVTNANAGQSKHNPDANGLSHAFDVGFISVSSGKNYSLRWDDKLFIDFNIIIIKKYPQVSWGGDWINFKDFPHFEV